MSETVQQNEIPGWYFTFQAAVLTQLPRPDRIDWVTAEGWIKNQSALKKVLNESLCPPGTISYGRLNTVCVHGGGEKYISADEYIRRACEKSGGLSDQKALDFYCRKENKDLLPNNNRRIVFPDTQFGRRGTWYVRYIFTNGGIWSQAEFSLANEMPEGYDVAIIAS